MMRFDAKFVAALAVGVLTMSALSGQVTYATDSGKPRSSETNNAKKDKKDTKKPVVVTVQPGDNLSSIAKEHDTTWTRIFDANEEIDNPDSINPGDKLVIPEADEELKDRSSEYSTAAAAVSTAQTATTYTTQSYSTAPINSSSYYVGNGMWCTDYVHSKRSDVPVYGNAGYNWISAAQADGKSTGSSPRQGAIAVTNGHVAYVESVNSDGSYVVSEMGWNYQAGSYNRRTVSPGAFGKFIY